MITFSTDASRAADLAPLVMVAVGLAAGALAATQPRVAWFRPRNLALRGFAVAVVVLTLLALLRH
ncbi:hypothetical protein [Dactylosporangium salmoneum]|uniref:Uncharacterized protein n=1 Tax=Dactylosporangium salmoneum TaxID=53361 RepID=A0ABN3GWS5_9ACTN